MPQAESLLKPSSLYARLEDAVQSLDQKLDSVDEWLGRNTSAVDEFQMQWQAFSENMSVQLAQVEQELVGEPAGPQLRIF